MRRNQRVESYVDDTGDEGYEVSRVVGRTAVDTEPPRLVVRLSNRRGFLPVSWQLRAGGGELLEEYRVTEFAKAEADGRIIWFPGLAEHSSWEGGKKVLVERIENSGIQVNEAVDEAELTFDPASVTRLYDMDANVFVEIAK